VAERFVLPLRTGVTPAEGRNLSSRQTQYVVRDLEIGQPNNSEKCQKLQMALHAKAKAEAGYRFYALYDKISREDILAHAYAQCRSNKGAPGVDGQDFAGRRDVWRRAVAWRTGACAPGRDLPTGPHQKSVHSEIPTANSGR